MTSLVVGKQPKFSYLIVFTTCSWVKTIENYGMSTLFVRLGRFFDYINKCCIISFKLTWDTLPYTHSSHSVSSGCSFSRPLSLQFPKFHPPNWKRATFEKTFVSDLGFRFRVTAFVCTSTIFLDTFHLFLPPTVLNDTRIISNGETNFKD